MSGMKSIGGGLPFPKKITLFGWIIWIILKPNGQTMTKFYIGGQYAVGQLAYLKKNGTANDTFIEAETLEEALEVFKAYAKTKDNPFDPGAKLIGMICT